MARVAVIGPEIYKRVGEVVAEGKTKSEAFSQVAVERGSSAGTVSANFYREARKAGTTRRNRREAAAKRPQPPRARAKTSAAKPADIATLTRTLTQTAESLVAAIRSQEREMADLRAKLDKARSLL
jgi:hypothetical protein